MVLLPDRGATTERRMSPPPVDAPGGPAAPVPALRLSTEVSRGAVSLVAASFIAPAARTSGNRRTGTTEPAIPEAMCPGTWFDSVGAGRAAFRRPRSGNAGRTRAALLQPAGTAFGATRTARSSPNETGAEEPA